MKVVKNIGFLQNEVAKLKKNGKTIGFVPTMGYLHEGHLSLIRRARKDCRVVVVSIFVNPMQFGPREDFKRYPRDMNNDVSLCRMYTDILFLPNAKTMYSDDFLTTVEVSRIGDIFCGASRPAHFKGVTTVVNKLFNIVLPDVAYFGQKDVQQAIIIKQMVKDLNMPVKIKVLPIVREHDGLAMSSRNSYLNNREREEAIALYRALILAKQLVSKGTINCHVVISKIRSLIKKVKTARIDYIGIVNPKTLLPLKTITKEALVLLAVFIGKTRLIDNTIIRRR